MKIFRNYPIGRFHVVKDDTFGLRSVCGVETKLETEIIDVDDKYDKNKLCRICTGKEKLKKGSFVTF